MKVRFEDIPEDGLRIDITDESWFPVDEVAHTGPVVANVYLEKRGHRVLAEGYLKVETLQDCDRCLDQFKLPLDFHFKIDLELAGDREIQESYDADHRSGDSEMDVLFVEEPEIDLVSVLQQQVFLGLPAKRLCRPVCKGLCSVCGVNLNETSCDCSPGKSASPFLVLEKLKK